MLNRFLLPLAISLSIVLGLSACKETNPPHEAVSSDLPLISVGDVTLKMELALTREQQRRGLMYRDGIEPDHGMLFVFKEPQEMSFWMKNVDFPIDIGYFTADGVLREIYPMYANDTQGRRSIRDDLLYVLEVESGWFKKNGVRPGALLDLAALQRALENR
ncbi:DUF192 domain-containing protein [Pelagicoccus sp. SDUM812003]|uniref:DUF192 domain-containing protein n=1 Tax=Pelagicoccus sp. SDUM812003 TaxID=3041267 RepID=UPI00280EDB99|nr:DUF192 domain-containing protein [Pelagicoccus sp. SDUM812003]MDQ8201935.1 DUF192 domain-containing protein [Pelagicoccus sp. SDUM812003]